jgi:predicted kinase
MARLTVLIGAPGSGKSTYAARAGGVVVTNDRASAEAPGDILRDSYRQIDALLADGRNVVYDTTGANPAIRKAALTLARKHDAEAVAVVLHTPLQTCLDVQRQRARPVSGAEVRRIHADVERQIPAIAGEGFEHVWVIRGRR